MFSKKHQHPHSAAGISLACYTRVSTDEQVENESLTTQAKNCSAFAERFGMLIADEHILREDESGMKLDRPQLNRQRDWIKQGRVNGVILNTSDRLSRKPSHGEILLDEFARYGVRLFIVYHGRELDVQEGAPDRDLLLQEMIFNRRWRYMLLEAMKRGKRGKAERGSIVTGGWTKYGFIKKQAGDIFVLDIEDDQATVVQNIFAWFVHERIGARKIQRMLSGIPNPGDVKQYAGGHSRRVRKFGEWSLGTIYRILRDESYAGRYPVYYLSEEYEPVNVDVPAIVDRATWEEAQQILDEGKAQSRRNAKYQFLMARRAKCALCEYAMHARQRDHRKADHRPYRQYVCGGTDAHDKTRECTLPTFNADMVDDVVWGWLIDKANDPDGIKKILKESQTDLEQINQNIYARIADIESQRRRQANKVDTLCAMYTPDDVKRNAEVRNLFERLKSETAEILAELRAEEDELRAQLQDATISDQYIEQWDRYMGRVRGKMENWPFEKRRQQIEDLNIRVFMTVENGKRVLCIAVYTYVEKVELDDFPTDLQTLPCS